MLPDLPNKIQEMGTLLTFTTALGSVLCGDAARFQRKSRITQIFGDEDDGSVSSNFAKGFGNGQTCQRYTSETGVDPLHICEHPGVCYFDHWWFCCFSL